MSAPPAVPATASATAQVARHGVLGLVGAVTAGAGGLGLTLAVSRNLDPRDTGVFFTAVAVFTILSSVLLLGADTGLIRSLAGLLATGRVQDIRPTIAAAVRPPLYASALVCLVGLSFAGPIARTAFPPAVAGDVAVALRVLAPFLVVATASALLLNGISRGLGSMRTFTLIQQIFLPVVRPLALLFAVLLGTRATGALWAWAVPLVVALLAGAADVRRRLAHGASTTRRERTMERRRVAGPFWRATAPRGLAATFEVLIVWADVVLVAAIRGPVEAGIYAAASRFVTSGTLAVQGMRLAIAPVLAAAFSRGDVAEAARVHRFSTLWAILTTWPVYLGIAAFAPGVLSLLGPGYGRASTALTILATAMLAVVATGNANTVLNMAGKSGWAALNTAAATTVMLGLDLLLVPQIGMAGAAVGWSAAMLTDSTLGLVEVRRGLHLRSFDRTIAEAATLAVAGFGLPALALQLVVPASIGGALTGIAVAGGAYVCLLGTRRQALRLGDFRSALRRGGN